MNERFVRAGVIARVDLAHEPDFPLGPIRVRPAQREISGEGWQESLEPRVMRLLVALARAKGEILSRDDLIECCWDGVIVGEDAINRCISRLRKAAEAGGNAFAIETIPRVGYRLKIADAPPAEVMSADEPSVSAASPGPPASGRPAAGTACLRRSEASASRRQGAVPGSRRSATMLSALAVLVLIVGGFALWRFWPAKPARMPAAPVESSVAVLPFVNMSGDPKQDYFSDGFSEELINDLSGDPRLLVTARSSAFAFKGQNVDAQTIARALHVHSVVEGSVREAGNRIRITAQLIDAARGYNIWSASYDRDVADILAVQGEVARDITIALTHKIIPGRRFKSGAIDPAAYRLLLEGREQLDLFSNNGYLRAYALLRQVTLRQPDFAEGFAAFSRAAWGAADADPEHYNSLATEAKEAAAKALVLDPGNIEAREMRGLFELEDWNWSAASADFRALRAQSPNNMRVLAGLRLYYHFMGFADASLETMQRARALDPFSDAPKRLWLHAVTPAMHRFRDVIQLSREILVHHPDDASLLVHLCSGYARTQQMSQARQILDHLRRLSDGGAQDCAFMIAVNGGDLAGARSVLETEISEFPDKTTWQAQTIAGGFVEIGEFDKASDWYERAYERRENFFPDTYDPFGPHNIGAKYRQTARWKALTRRPAFREWQAEHDRIAAELAAHNGAP